MANVPYNPIPNVEPEARPPEDYQNVRASPESFGGLIAQGAEKAGQGVLSAGKFWGQVQTDDILNKTLPQLDANLVTFRSLEGQAALDAQPEYEKTQQSILDNAKASLSTADQQLAFERSATSYAQRLRLVAGTHVVEQGKIVANKTNDDAYTLALSHGAMYYTQPDMYQAAIGDATGALIKNLQARGLDTPEARQDAMNKAHADVAKSATEAAMVNHPDTAMKILDANKDYFGGKDGAVYDELYARARESNAKQGGLADFKEAASAVHNGWRGNIPGKTTNVSAGEGGPARGNNPGNIVDGAWARSQPGYIGANGRFAQFDSIASGTAAMGANLKSYAAQGVTTLNQLTAKWAPAGDGANNPQAYARTIASATGIDPDAPINLADPAVQSKIIPAMAQVEQGHPVAGTTPTGHSADRLPTPVSYNAPATTEPTIMPAGADPANPASAIPNPVALSPIIPKAPVLPLDHETPEDILAHQIQHIKQNGQSEDRQRVATAWAHEEYNAAKIAAEATAKDKAARVNEASADYVRQILTGNVRPNIYQQIANDPRLAGNGEAMEHMAEFISKWTGKPPEASFGADFGKVMDNTLTKPDAPGHISLQNFQEVYRQWRAGARINPAGIDFIYKTLQQNAKSVDKQTSWVVFSKAMKSAETYLSFDGQGAIPGVYAGMKDPDGPHAIDEFTSELAFGYSRVMQKAEETGDMKPVQEYLSEKNVKELAGRIRSQRDLERAKIRASIGDAYGPNALPPPPRDVQSGPWQTYVATPPSVGGKPIPYAQWANILDTLIKQPTNETIQYFDKHFGPAGFSAEKIVRDLRGGLVGKPENVGNEPPKEDAMMPLFNTTMGLTP